jgi:hypothetical protein
MPDASSANNLCGTFQVGTDAPGAYQLTYQPGGPATRGSGDSTQAVPISDPTSGSFSTSQNLTIGGQSYSIQGQWDSASNVWKSAATSSPQWTMANLVPFASNYLLLVYQVGLPRSVQCNVLGGSLSLTDAGSGSMIISITVGQSPNSNSGTASCTFESRLPTFGHAGLRTEVTLQSSAVKYTFNTMMFAKTKQENRIVVYGDLTISGQSVSYQYVAVQWNPGTLPQSIWNITGQPSNEGLGSLNFPGVGGPYFQDTAGNKTYFAQPNPTISWGAYLGMPQLIVNGPNNTTNPASQPENLSWSFGGAIASSSATDDTWTASADIANVP